MKTYTGTIQIGDVVTRCRNDKMTKTLSKKHGLYGIVVGRSMEGNPIHPCIHVVWPMIGRPTSIAESYVEVVCKKGNE